MIADRIQPDLVKLVEELHEDLRQRCDEVREVNTPLLVEYAEAHQAKRTQETFQAWRDNYLNQVAVAWVLAGVFVRYLEDNQLVDECWLAGEGPRKAEARERYMAFFRAHPEWSDREFFHEIFLQVSRLPGCHDLFAKDRNPLWKVGISGDGAKKLREFFAEVDSSSGELLRTFGGDTRFLGDLYQNLSEEAQKKYALLQTPDFVEEFILDRTLEPAIVEFGLDQVKLIDPTCGSGHFLLGAFSRLFQKWQSKAPAENPRVLARRALEAVYGVDINPFAAAIARFRLVIAFVQACGLSLLREMPDVKIHVATGDSLLHGNTLCSAKGWGTQELSDWLPDAFAAGDFGDASRILSQRYEAVVGNPPYIVVRDKAQNQAIRDRYRTAYRQYSLAVPFKEKFWDLAVETKGPQRAGFIGMITANSFMKKEFGSRLVEEFFPKVDLTHVLNTSGAEIPGHKTPTVILLGRNQPPRLTTVRTVLARARQTPAPQDPASGLVWRSILELLDVPNQENRFISTRDFPRSTFERHPWNIGGGGASELKEKMGTFTSSQLSDLCVSIGRTTVVGEDDIWSHPKSQLSRLQIADFGIQLVIGETVRDYGVSDTSWCIYPYTVLGGQPMQKLPLAVEAFLWPYRAILERRTVFGKSLVERQLPYWVHLEHYTSKLSTPYSITFAEVASHNHFALDSGGKLFKQTAPIIKLPEGATPDEHLALLALLNTSAVCFYLKQVSTVKNMEGKIRVETFSDGYQFSCGGVGSIPIPQTHIQGLQLARKLHELAAQHSALEPANITKKNSPLHWQFPVQERAQRLLRTQMIALQEELDWLSYQLYGILEQAPLAQVPPPLQLGERAFEIALARSDEETTWFSRHGSTPIREIPPHWPPDYSQLVQKRLELIANHPEIALLEKPEHKRRWQQQGWNERVRAALQEWLGVHIEDVMKNEEHPLSASQLADRLAPDSDFQKALSLYLGRDDYDLSKEITQLVQPQAVAYLAALRYSEAGLRVRADWEATWALQRRQDAGEDVGDIPVPPKYGQKDFARPECWSLRGKLDVAKERFISYPGAEREADTSPVLGWAGWNHLQRAQALASCVVARREEDGWGVERLTPLLAGLAELLPWLKQWHNNVDEQTGERMGDYFEAFLGEQMRELELTARDLADWRPAAKTKTRAKKA